MTLATVTPAFLDDFGVINAAALNSWRTELPQAIDATGGGSYTPGGAGGVISVQGSGFGTIDVHTLAEVLVGGQRVSPVGADVADTDAQTFTIAEGQTREFVTPTAQRDHEISTDDAIPGSWIHFVRPATGNFAIILHRVGSAAAIVTLPQLTWASATVYYDVTGVWRLLEHNFGVAGAEA